MTTITETMTSSFRPLAGIMVLISCGHTGTVQIYGTFPSPCGDYGSYQLQTFSVLSSQLVKFPSPCGDYGSYRLHTKILNAYRW